MDIVVLDKTTYQPLGLVEIYGSMIWNERFRECGDFQLNIPIDTPAFSLLALDNYLSLLDSDRVMIIEYMKLETSSINGKRTAEFKGRSLESILERRIVWSQTDLNGYLLTELKRILTENLINPVDSNGNPMPERQISNFRFIDPDPSSETYQILSQIQITCQYTGKTLYEVVTTMAKECGFGWKITLSKTGTFDFELFVGTDRTFNTTENVNPVLFSPEFENLSSSRVACNTQKYKNITLVMGEDSGEARRRITVWSGMDDSEPQPTGLDRRELYTDARDLQSEREDGSVIPEAQYYASLKYRGQKKLADVAITSAFDGEMENSIGPQYNKDFFIGDYVSVVNEYGFGSVAQVLEFIRSNNSDGYSEYPTFAMIA